MEGEPRWGDGLSAHTLSDVERPSPRPVTHLAMRADPPPRGAGEEWIYTFAGVSCTDSPQPHAETWFGLLKMNWACILSAL
jgi:hypothetical protein